MKKKLYILRPIGYTGPDWEQGLWNPWYDKCFGFVVSAESEEEAREIASKSARNETAKAWLSLKESTCTELAPTVKSQIIIRDFAAA